MSNYRTGNPDGGQGADPSRDELFDAHLDDVSSFWTSSDVVPTPVRRENVYLGADVEYPRFMLSRRMRHALIVGVPVLCVLLVVLMLGLSVSSVVGQAKAAKESATGMLQGMKSGDEDAVGKSVSNLAKATGTMCYEAESPIWEFASCTPFVGADVANVRELVHVADDVVTNGLEPISKKLAGVSMSSFMSDGEINAESLQNAVLLLGELAPSLKRASESFDEMQPGSIRQLNDAITQGDSILETVVNVADNADVLAEHIPDMLGANGEPRNYLVLAQSNAELRSVGGFPGSWGRLVLDNGKLELGDFASPQNVRQEVDIAKDEQSIYNTDSVDMVTSVGTNPNYPRVAEVVSQIYALEQEGYGDGYLMVDGIIAVDPIFLGEILKLTGGSVDVEGVHVDGNNAAEFILSRVYWDLPVAKQDAMFAAIAQLAFSELTHGLGKIDLSDFGNMIGTGAANRDLMVWFRDVDEQEVIQTLGLSGALKKDPVEPYTGVYFNDFTWSKIDWYLNSYTDFGTPVENADGTKTYHVTTTLENHLTDQLAKDAPDYVVGSKDNSLIKQRGEMLTYVLVYAPVESKLENVKIDDENKMIYSKTFNTGNTDGHEMASGLTRLKPGESLHITYDVTVPAEAEEYMQLDTTPTPQHIAGWKPF
ncbi:MAG: DUF4012 domain-containing protein [Coriobacteriales bacterium]|nr:DUF4012 domain-containing protein [Coriobacteriales bacterium]